MNELLGKLEVVKARVVVDALVVALSCNRRQVGRCSLHARQMTRRRQLALPDAAGPVSLAHAQANAPLSTSASPTATNTAASALIPVFVHTFGWLTCSIALVFVLVIGLANGFNIMGLSSGGKEEYVQRVAPC